MTNPNKLIVFVDDKPATHAAFRDAIKDDTALQHFEIALAFDLQDAVELIEQEKQRIAAVISDLHLPDYVVPDQLDAFYRQRCQQIQRNEGQMLGEYLRSLTPPIPYLYLAAYTSKYQPDWEACPPPPCLSKDESDHSFISELKQIMGINGITPPQLNNTSK